MNPDTSLHVNIVADKQPTPVPSTKFYPRKRTPTTAVATAAKPKQRVVTPPAEALGNRVIAYSRCSEWKITPAHADIRAAEVHCEVQRDSSTITNGGRRLRVREGVEAQVDGRVVRGAMVWSSK
ncbi:MAG: hypothetical protein Q9199_001279 [Rusavskia elegans]